MSGDCFYPKNPSRADILATVGTQGQDKFRNPVRLEEVKGEWPKRHSDDWWAWGESERKRISGMEGDKLHRNGSLK